MRVVLPAPRKPPIRAMVGFTWATQDASYAEGFSFFQGGVGGVELAVEGEGAAFQRAVIDVQGGAGRGDVEGAPAGGGAPETAVSPGALR